MTTSPSDPQKNSPFAYVINNERLTLSLAIMNISVLRLHEENIPELLEQLAKSIKKDGYVKHPIMVDEKSLVVLDGMHRVAALKKLGCRRIPVCLVDYESPAVKVCSWYRTIKGAKPLELILAQAEQARSTLQQTKELENTIGVSPIVAAIKTQDKAFLIKAFFKNLEEAYNIVKLIELRLKTVDFEVKYETESDALRKLQQCEVDAVLCTPKLTKSAIVETALSGRLFTYKATRHVFPARALNLNVPLNLLKDTKRPLNEVNAELRSMLQKRHLKRLPAGSIFKSKRYEEELYVFEE